jgi:hypothetical protein
MINFAPELKIFLHVGPIDMRNYAELAIMWSLLSTTGVLLIDTSVWWPLSSRLTLHKCIVLSDVTMPVMIGGRNHAARRSENRFDWCSTRWLRSATSRRIR